MSPRLSSKIRFPQLRFFWMPILAMVSASALTIPSGHAGELEDTRTMLEHELALIEVISRSVERIDYATLTLLRLRVTSVLKNISELGLGHKDTFLAFQELVHRQKYSQSSFKLMATDENSAQIAELRKLADEISKRYGFDDSPYTRHTYNDFMAMKKLFLQLESMPISEGLRAKIVSLNNGLKTLLGIAKVDGDRPVTFELGQKMFFTVQTLYPELEVVAVGDPAFDIVNEIEALNETYAEFSQVFRLTQSEHQP